MFDLPAKLVHDQLAEHQAALNLNPSFALARTTYGWALLRAGRFDDAISETAKALRMSPMDSFSGLYTTTHGLALLAANPARTHGRLLE